ncbi:TetR/AcrR family transcriptional regulator C-terminal domain-containing protein [Microbacterium sp. ARD31]|uniref:TetR/AcrR family transcriptional regulator C-terminal domain-containing protein n=1 Tax=Microbacterium sp. ARD31 TaxID=2962576 RepID=UPI0028817502|nr:TetR/AcrR family transcriptional regulator C-terminal domain-containing protein [Microbacterium sp. ARD31]MDT0184019.1 TetR/AcrR family transcriptional regulator C-terminal domain-containing protein [Microbacterium sp. ARD31]
MTDTEERGVVRRGRGRPRVIDRDQIVTAARGLDPETLTMQSLADELGIPRKTLHYHVGDREELLRLAAVDTLKSNLTDTPFERSEDWREAVRTFASHTRRSVIAAGAWMNYVPFDGREDLLSIGPAETALEALVAAGFDVPTAARALGLAAEFSLSSARDAILRQEQGAHPQRIFLGELLEQTAEGEYTVLKQLNDVDWDEFGSEQQFEFDLKILVYGLERLLAGS